MARFAAGVDRRPFRPLRGGPGGEGVRTDGSTASQRRIPSSLWEVA
jgi:hypothetical protein